MSDNPPTEDSTYLPIAWRVYWKIFLPVALGLAAFGASILWGAALHYRGVPTTGTIVAKVDRLGSKGSRYVVRIVYADGAGERHEFERAVDAAAYNSAVAGTTAVPVCYDPLIPSHATQTGAFGSGPIGALVTGLLLLAAAVPCAVVGGRDLYAGWRVGRG
jgi:hypothetical protein